MYITNIAGKPSQKQSTPAGEGSYFKETGYIYNYPRIHDKARKFLREEQGVHSRWTEYNCKTATDVAAILFRKELRTILCEITKAVFKKWHVRVDNITAMLVQADGTQ